MMSSPQGLAERGQLGSLAAAPGSLPSSHLPLPADMVRKKSWLCSDTEELLSEFENRKVDGGRTTRQLLPALPA